MCADALQTPLLEWLETHFLWHRVTFRRQVLTSEGQTEFSYCKPSSLLFQQKQTDVSFKI